MARPTKLDKRTQGLILVGVRLGLTYEDAARAAGIHRSTFHRWIQKGKAAKSGKFCDFCDALSRANAEAQLTTAKIIHDAAKGGQVIKETRIVSKADGTKETTTIEKKALPDVRSAMFILERRFPESWGRKDALKVEVDWRQELAQIGVDPDETIEYLVEYLRNLTTDATRDPAGSDSAIEV